MRLGIFAKTFVRPTLDGVLDAVVSHGIDTIQFNFACAGMPSMPDRIEAAVCERIHAALDARGLTMAAVSGTFNMIDPEVDKRRDGLARLREIARACPPLGTSVITMCTGTRDPANMWRRHPDNDTPGAWRDLLETMGEAVTIAEGCNVTLAFEPEVANVVDTAQKGRRLLDEIRSPHLRVVMDPANLFHAGQLPRMTEILDEAFSLLGEDIVLAHAKDLSHDGEAGHEPAGRGVLDYGHYLSLLRDVGFPGALILHGLEERDVAASVAYLRRQIAAVERPELVG